jgi:hypothetical protein
MTSLAQNIRHTNLYKDVRIEQLHEQLAERAISQEYFDRKVKELEENHTT